jgi:3-oxoacyl-[acyl-carrier-protein] synthase-3
MRPSPFSDEFLADRFCERNAMTRQPTDPSQRPHSSERSRLYSLMGVQILGLGSSTPDNVIRNEDLAALGYDSDWIVQRTGIRQRRHAPAGMATSDLAVEAARRCIDQAQVDPAEIDLVLVGTFTPDLHLPSTACLVQDRLGLRAPAMDLHAACASFVYGLLTGSQFIASGNCRRVLVIGADCNSRVVNPADERTFPLFGDGAGAALLGAGSQEQGIVAMAAGSDGSGVGMLYQPMGGTRMPFSREPGTEGLQYLHMDGRAVFKWAVRTLIDTTSDVLHAAGLSVDDLSLVVFHQANLRIILTAAKELGLPGDKLYNNLEFFGNTASASIPLALDEAHRKGRIRPGDYILVSGFGAGLIWATAILRW